MSVVSGLFFRGVILGNVIIFVAWLAIAVVFEADIFGLVASFLFVVVFIVLNIISVYFRERSAALNFILNKIA